MEEVKQVDWVFWFFFLPDLLLINSKSGFKLSFIQVKGAFGEVVKTIKLYLRLFLFKKLCSYNPKD